jgi:thiol-disulfide isomerase/thioredoxin
MNSLMKFIRKNLSNILLVLFALFLFSPYGLPVRAFLIKGVSKVTTLVFDLEIDEEDRVSLGEYNWQLVSRRGEAVSFSDMQGKVVPVNFWATWCPPCIAEMPGMQDLFEAYGDRVEFLFVARDDPERVEGFISKNQYSFPVFFEITSPPDVLSSNSLPTTYVIDASGVIRVEKVGAADWNSDKVRDLLEELLK